MELSKISAVKNINFGKSERIEDNDELKVDLAEEAKDEFKSSDKEKIDPPKIGFFRAAFGFFTQDQIDQVNAAGRLPENCKFVRDYYGGYRVSNNIFNVIPGTTKIPAGFEVQKTIFGFISVVPQETKSVFLKNK